MNRNTILYAVGALGVLLAAAVLQFIPLGLALVFVVVIVILAVGEMRDRANKARYEEQLRNWHTQNLPAGQGWEPPQSSARPPKSAWSAAGSLLAVFAAVGGLAILSLAVLLFVVLSSANFKLGNK